MIEALVTMRNGDKHVGCMSEEEAEKMKELLMRRTLRDGYLIWDHKVFLRDEDITSVVFTEVDDGRTA